MIGGDSSGGLAAAISNSLTADPTFRSLVEDFRHRWGRGECPPVESYLDRLNPDRPFQISELIFLEYVLRIDAGRSADPSEYYRRFPEHRESLSRLFALDLNQIPADLEKWAAEPSMPAVGGRIGNHRFLRALGKGGFATVFLVEQVDLPGALSVVKISSRITSEAHLLARLRHPHIVEVTSQFRTRDDKQQWMSMPFHGGATISDLLQKQREPWRGRPRTGKEFLAILDEVAAPEKRVAGVVHSTRQRLASISAEKAAAWIVARIAGALDHADRNEVNHGDVKPSNILICEDGTPRLLDFNLATDRSDADFSKDDFDRLGGTLPYWPPEKLALVRGAEPSSQRPRSAALRSDLYSLGLVLLEMVSDLNLVKQSFAPLGLKALVARFYEQRAKGPSSFKKYLRRLPVGLRPILEKLLAADPAERYDSGSALAEDLDAWIEDHPPGHATAGPYIQARLFLKRRRGAVVASLFCVAAVGVFLGYLHYQREYQAGSRIWEIHESYLAPGKGDLFLSFPKRGIQGWGPEREDPDRVIRDLRLGEGPYLTDRPGFWTLETEDQEEIEAFALEQVYRKASGRLESENSRRREWDEALRLVEWVLASRRIDSFLGLREQLLAKMKLSKSGRSEFALEEAPPWLQRYIEGIAVSPLHAREAWDLFDQVVAEKPRMFWGSHRLACVSWRLDFTREAETYVGRCLERHPGHPVLVTQLASIFMRGSKHVEAEDLLEAALAQGTELPEDALDIRALLSLLKRQDREMAKLIDEAARAREPGKGQLEWERKRQELYAKLRYAYLLRSRNNDMGLRWSDSLPQESELRNLLERFNEDQTVRLTLASLLARQRRYEEAVLEYSKVLSRNSNHLFARFGLARTLHAKGDKRSAAAEFRLLIDHPLFEELLREAPEAFESFQRISDEAISQNRFEDLESLAERWRDMAVKRRREDWPVDYALARVLVCKAGADPSLRKPAATALRWLYSHHPMTISRWVASDRMLGRQAKWLNPMIGPEMGVMPASASTKP